MTPVIQGGSEITHAFKTTIVKFILTLTKQHLLTPIQHVGHPIYKMKLIYPSRTTSEI